MHVSCLQAYDPIIDADVKQRSFAPADDKQAVLMEMFAESQLRTYHKELSAYVKSCKPKVDNFRPQKAGASADEVDAAAAEGEATLHVKEPQARLSRIARRPVIACAFHASHSAKPALRLCMQRKACAL